jgi:hypothetical protein
LVCSWSIAGRGLGRCRDWRQSDALACRTPHRRPASRRRPTGLTPRDNLIDRSPINELDAPPTTTDGAQCARVIPGGTCHQHRPANDTVTQIPRDGLPPIRLHDLRHGSATYALTAGIQMRVVSEDLGHADTRITENLYTSVLPEPKQAAAEAIADTIRGTDPPDRQQSHDDSTDDPESSPQ